MPVEYLQLPSPSLSLLGSHLLSKIPSRLAVPNHRSSLETSLSPFFIGPVTRVSLLFSFLCLSFHLSLVGWILINSVPAVTALPPRTQRNLRIIDSTAGVVSLYGVERGLPFSSGQVPSCPLLLHAAHSTDTLLHRPIPRSSSFSFCPCPCPAPHFRSSPIHPSLSFSNHLLIPGRVTLDTRRNSGLSQLPDNATMEPPCTCATFLGIRSLLSLPSSQQ